MGDSKQVFASKIGIGLTVFLGLSLGFGCYISIKQGMWSGVLINILVGIFIAYIFLSTHYTIDGASLHVRCGFLVNSTFSIDRIVKITETYNPMGAPAASLDRLQISFGNGSSVVISPKRKNEFIQVIQQLNPNIEVSLRNNRN